MKRVAIIGAGISGLSLGQMLKDKYEVTIYEKENTPGGLIRCQRIEGSLFHICGGHVFNSKNQDVLKWFWNHFNQDTDFQLADRNAVVFMHDGKRIPYPIENHSYLFDQDVLKSIIDDWVYLAQHQDVKPENFEEFLKGRFGNTLYQLYFKPYNQKVWRRDLSSVPLSWLEGKLPMPTVSEMIYNNIHHVEEKQFVHSRFYYEKKDGSQFIANRLAEGLNILYGRDVKIISKKDSLWYIDNTEYDIVVYCGNIKDLPTLLEGVDISSYTSEIGNLEYHGTTSVFCEIDANPYSWIYQPSPSHESHRIICTGNFAPSNNSEGKMTGTIEFTDYISEDEIMDNLKRIPLHPRYITHHYNQCTYPIQDKNTRTMIQNIKSDLAKDNFYFTGRFADWEYYNMDVAIAASMNTVNSIEHNN